MTTNQTVSVRLDPSTLDKITELAVQDHRSRSSLIQHAVAEYVALRERGMNMPILGMPSVGWVGPPLSSRTATVVSDD